MSLENPATDAPSNGPTRRHLMRQAAAVGAAGLAVSLVAGAGGGAAEAATTDRSPAGEPAPAQAPEHDEPMIVHVRDARTGRLDLFSGEKHHAVQDPALAAALVRALG